MPPPNGRLTAAALLAVLSLTASPVLALEVGDRAPDFSLPGSDGKQHDLAETLKSRGGVVLAWFPKAFTPG